MAGIKLVDCRECNNYKSGYSYCEKRGYISPYSCVRMCKDFDKKTKDLNTS